MIGRWMRWHLSIERRHIKHLEREVLYWRTLAAQERQRAELAIDACRNQHQQLGPVSLPLRPTSAPDMDKEIEALLSDPEIRAVGNPSGVP